MIDHAAHFQSIVKDELASAATANGLDKTQMGFTVAFVGPTPVQTPGGQVTMLPAWMVVVTTRSSLLGQPPIPVAVTVPGPVPPDDDFRGSVKMAVQMAADERDKQLRGDAA